MALTEFDLISRYFDQPGLRPDHTGRGAAIALAIGDDCALLDIPADQQLVLTLDVLVADVHFPAGGDPAGIAAKALSVNLSDLAAMGADPLAFTLGLTLPSADEAWLEGFARGLRQVAERHGCPLIGGDTTRGSLNIAIQAHGLVPRGQALRRSGARAGDLVWVTGSLGDGGAGLDFISGKLSGITLSSQEQRWLEQAYYEPEPRLAAGRRLRGLASAAIDISDGLLADLNHIATRSQVGIRLNITEIPIDPICSKALGTQGALECALGAGDDYELAFTLPKDKVADLRQAMAEGDFLCTCIGEVVEPGSSETGSRVQCVDEAGNMSQITRTGYKHF